MNEEKFTGKASLYAKYRLSYPKQLIDYLFRSTEAETVADIGAGTGIFTKCLEDKPWKVTAVEPNSDMLSQLEQTVGKNVTILQNPAEDTGLADNSTDLVTVAQAFHWFDAMKFKSECKRIFTEKGKLAIIWNGRSDCPLQQERNRVCMKYCNTFHSGHTGKLDEKEGDLFLRNEFFASVEFSEIISNVSFSLDRFIGDNLSRSYAPSENDEHFDAFKKELTDVFYRYEKDGAVILPYTTACYLGTL